MKKIALCIIPLIVSLILQGCTVVRLSETSVEETKEIVSEEIKKPISERSLYEHGIDIIKLMNVMAASEDYHSAVSSSSGVVELVATAVAEKPESPSGVYEICGIGGVGALGADYDEAMNKMDGSLKEYLNSRIGGNFGSIINGRGSYGTEGTVASSFCTASKTFVNSSVTENTVYLYTYENSRPVMVSYVCGDDNSVYAVGQFLFDDGFKTDTKDNIEEYFAELPVQGITLKDVER